jgi:anti-sigma-K factor RskA
VSNPLGREERMAMIAAGRRDVLHAEEVADVARLADALADPSAWVDPSVELEDHVATAVAQAPERENAGRRDWRSAGVAVAASIAVALIVTFAGGHHRATPEFDALLRSPKSTFAASASVAITENRAGYRVTVDAHGLPPLAGAEFYQAWLRDDAGVRVPIGTFTSSDDHVTMWSGVSPESFSTMWVTIETADDGSGPSSDVVLVGPVHKV